MPDVEPYVDMPYSEIVDLKKQLKQLQTKDNVDADTLLKSMNSLTKNMESMLQLFKTAADEMKLEEEEEKALSKEIKPLMDKLDEIMEQNKIIAEGMIAISDLVKERLPEKSQQEEEEEEPQQKFPRMPPRPVQRQMPPLGQPPNMYGERPIMQSMPQPMAPQQMPAQPMPSFPSEQNNFDMELPPPPPDVPQKKGIFGRR